MPASGEAGWVRIPADLRLPTMTKQMLEAFGGFQVKEMRDGSCLIKKQEDYLRSGKPRIDLLLLARGPGFESSGLARLRNLTPITQAITREKLEGSAELRKQQATWRTDDEPLWFRFGGELNICMDSDLESKLREFQLQGEDTDSLWLAEVDVLLSRRLAFMRAVFAQRHTREAVRVENFIGLLAASDLMANSSGSFTIYFHPLLLLNSPWVGGFTAMRTNATIIRLLTIPEPGRTNVWTDQLDSFQPSYAGSSSLFDLGLPAEDLETREQLLQWWSKHLSDLLLVISDPTRHVDGEGNYEPSSHLGSTLTIERIFVTAVEVMRLKTKDEVLRKILLFDFLDLLEGRGMGTYETNLSHVKQYKAWLRLKTTLPEPVARAFSSQVEGAFEALRQVENGFWLKSSRTPDGRLCINTKDGAGRREGISLDRARGEYIRVLRNSHHGFRKIAANPRDLSYLASHTGVLDNRLPDLVWWFLIRILADPSQVAPTRGRSDT